MCSSSRAGQGACGPGLATISSLLGAGKPLFPPGSALRSLLTPPDRAGLTLSPPYPSLKKQNDILVMNELGVLLPVDLVSPTRLRGLEIPRLSLSVELQCELDETNSSLETGSTFDRTIEHGILLLRLCPDFSHLSPGSHAFRAGPRGAHSSLLTSGPQDPRPGLPACTHSSLGVLLPVRTRRGPSSPRRSASGRSGGRTIPRAHGRLWVSGRRPPRALAPRKCVGRPGGTAPASREHPGTLSVRSALGPPCGSDGPLGASRAAVLSVGSGTTPRSGGLEPGWTQSRARHRVSRPAAPAPQKQPQTRLGCRVER